MSELITKAMKAKEATSILNSKSTENKNQALQSIAAQLRKEQAYILEENNKDIKNAQKNGVHVSLIDRLRLNPQRLEEIALAVQQLVALDDPTGKVLATWKRPNGLEMNQVSVPLGVVGMIYEARPNVTVDAASLCLKTGNAVLLRGSSSAIHSNKALVKVIQQGLEHSDFPIDAVQLLEDTRRETATEMFKLKEYLDVLIPRGGKHLIQTVVEQATVPVLETGAGNCHLFIDETADPQMAIDITINAKTQRPSVCNAIETVLIHKQWAAHHFRVFVASLRESGVELRGDEGAQAMVPGLIPAVEADWQTEYLDKILAVKLVNNVDEAITHINKYGTKHSEAIITENQEHVKTFFERVDAAALYHNASTRFTDGFEFGFGAEIGISTQKLHARGPMGLTALTTTKYQINGHGQIKA
ncbi:glutamate-5-semialdehyde dehydrogenase [Pullulanibacillus pueri]|uniref:Gamma-glutamyl phosphate reductase n=1 Tax=Pullulanibacillus pueri TaxID=1437324 RepID=A0A8J3EKU6_9BACL|nr:glutamate-5-semialdehyde dehydrogenase [Pullulanibacillus pueri]MBM7681050.1 glutamate-5-semialdehyde dehydrogenase [Pullulanibacillus pueri]GGH76845.1 gamma-glutamyl phosphate reductase [Pullulanibacillus pueri]